MAGTEPTVGTVATASTTVDSSDLASALLLEPGDNYPRVYATARMIALMEIASARILNHYLQPGQLSVGVNVDVKHSAPTAQGVRVTAEATYVGREGKLFKFDVVANDAAGEIGRGRHTRGIVDATRIETLAKTRSGGRTKL